MFAHLNFWLEPEFKFFTISSGVSWIDLNTVNKANKLNIILMATEYSQQIGNNGSYTTTYNHSTISVALSE